MIEEHTPPRYEGCSLKNEYKKIEDTIEIDLDEKYIERSQKIEYFEIEITKDQIPQVFIRQLLEIALLWGHAKSPFWGDFVS